MANEFDVARRGLVRRANAQRSAVNTQRTNAIENYRYQQTTFGISLNSPFVKAKQGELEDAYDQISKNIDDQLGEDYEKLDYAEAEQRRQRILGYINTAIGIAGVVSDVPMFKGSSAGNATQPALPDVSATEANNSIQSALQPWLSPRVTSQLGGI